MARSATGHDAPDPSLGGPIRNIVKSAHKWGGNGTIPLFNKIKRVLLAKHPEVIAKSFGGDANKAAAWIKDNWMAMHGHDPTHWRGKGKSTAQQLATELQEDADSEFFTVELSDDDFTIEDLFQEVPLSLFDEGAELFLSDTGDFEERDGLLWTPICRTGTWVRSPLPGGKPLKLTKEHFEQAIDAFNNKAWEYVTIPLTHEDRVDENTGYIQGLEIREDPTRPGQHRLWGGHKFTEPEIEEKVRRKSIIGRSVLLAIGGHKDTETGKFWPTVLKHVALTNKPWLNGLNDGVLAASQDGTAPTYELETDPEESGDAGLAKRLMNFLKQELELQVEDDDGMTPGAIEPNELHRFVGRYGGKCALCGARYGQANHHGRAKSGRGVDPGLRDNPGDGVYAMELGDGGVGDLALGWLEKRGVKRSDLDSGDFLIPPDTLPYKVHGNVDPDGWKAAWGVVNGGHGWTPPKGYSVQGLKKKLLASKPKGVDVAASVVIITKGGVGDMGEKKDGENEVTEEVRLSKEEFQTMVSEAAQEAVKAERAAWETRQAELEARLSQSESTAHELRVDRQLAAYQEKGVPPAVLTRVRDIMLAQQEEGGELKLSQTDEEGKTIEVKLSVADAMASVLDSIPEALLAKGQQDLSLAHGAGDPPSAGDDPTDKAKEKADKLWEDMHSGEVAHVS